MHTPRSLCVMALAGMLLAGCSSSSNSSSSSPQPVAAAAPAAAPEVVTAKTAFWEMYKTAHAWASDAEPIRLTMKTVPGYKNDDGKAGMWEAVFASPSLGSYRTFTYSIADVPPSISKGVDTGLALAWSGPSRDAMPIDTSEFSIDSDAAYTAAAADAAAWIKANPGKEISDFEVGDTSKFADPVWYILWGTKKAGYAAIIDANSGKVLKGKSGG
jgi:hypothetical protein